MDGVARRVREEGGERNKGNGGNDGNDNAKERSAQHFSASFSSGKEVEEPCPLSLLQRRGKDGSRSGGRAERGEGE